MKSPIRQICYIISKLYSRLDTEVRFLTIKTCLKIIKKASLKK